MRFRKINYLTNQQQKKMANKTKKPTYKKHLSASAFKSLQQCSARQVAIDTGKFDKPISKGMMVGKYVDAYFSGTIDVFKAENPQIFKKDGSFYAEYLGAYTVIETIKSDPLLLKYVKGDKLQYEVKGKIGGDLFKGFIDSLHIDTAMVDLKIMADLYTRFWSESERCYVLWIEHFGYDRQMAIYQELIRQETGKQLPCFLAVATKQNPPDKAVIQIPQGRMDMLLDDIKENAKDLLQYRNGKVPPVRCEKCDYCRATKKLTEVITVFDLM